MNLTVKYYFLDYEDNDGTEALNLKDFDYPHFLPEQTISTDKISKYI
jgi:hypothetical protein